MRTTELAYRFQNSPLLSPLPFKPCLGPVLFATPGSPWTISRVHEIPLHFVPGWCGVCVCVCGVLAGWLPWLPRSGQNPKKMTPLFRQWTNNWQASTTRTSPRLLQSSLLSSLFGVVAAALQEDFILICRKESLVEERKETNPNGQVATVFYRCRVSGGVTTQPS